MISNTRSLKLRRAIARGVTLFEVLIVVAILALVAGGVAIAALPALERSRIKQAEIDAKAIRKATQTFQLEGGTDCPTTSKLKEEKFLDAGSNTADPWGSVYEISCTEDEVTVLSYGADKKKGGEDDIIVPKGAAATAGP